MAQAPSPLPFSKKALHSLWEGDPKTHRAGAGPGGEAEGSAPGGPGEDLPPLRVWSPVSALGADPRVSSELCPSRAGSPRPRKLRGHQCVGSRGPARAAQPALGPPDSSLGLGGPGLLKDSRLRKQTLRAGDQLPSSLSFARGKGALALAYLPGQ